MPTDVSTSVPRPRPNRNQLRTRIIVLSLLWIVALVPFVLLRQDTWFGRPLSDQQIGEYLHAEHRPKLILHALAQIERRMAQHDDSVSMWYADLVRLSTNPDENVREADATVMGGAASVPDIHQALLDQLHDDSSKVRFNAALSLAQAGDASGHREIVAILQGTPATDTVLRALAALQRMGVEQDISLVERYQASNLPERVRQQALATENAIRARGKR